MNEILHRIGDIGIVPVIKIEDVEKAAPLADALIAGGLPVAEVTFRAARADEAIRRIADACPDMLVGAGTVLTCEQADAAIRAGAKFIVAPGLNPKVVRYCLEHGVPVTPGVCSPSEIEQALELGLDVVKFFPAEQAGGVAAIKAMSAPYGALKFIPTGGINAKNLNDYLSFPKVLACGGSWMVKADLIAAGDFAEIERLTREAVSVMLGMELAHVGVNIGNEPEAQAEGAAMQRVLCGASVKQSEKSLTVGGAVEFMKQAGPGTKGHIGLRTNSVPRAMAYLAAQGVCFDECTARLDDAGRVKFIYLADEIGGFAVHIMQK